MDIKDLIRKHEGLVLKPYFCTSGKLTIGYGRNLEDLGISIQEAELMLQTDIARCFVDLQRVFPDLLSFPQELQAVLVDMMFNLGLPRFLGFQKFIAAIRERDYNKAAEEMKNSHWYEQVTNRVNDDIALLKSVK